MNRLPTHYPLWTSNPLSSFFLTCQILLVIRTHLCHWSRPPRSYGRPSYRTDKLHNVYPSEAGTFLSHPSDACHSMCGIGRNSVKTAYHLKAFDILSVFGIPCYGTEFITFPNFIAISGPGASRLSFTEGDALQYAISANHVSETTPISWFGLQFCQFVPVRITTGQRSARSTKCPRCSTLATTETVTRIPSDSFDFSRTCIF